jgi:S-adenosylmethionine:tRNA ribosyltransferase-isomerase
MARGSVAAIEPPRSLAAASEPPEARGLRRDEVRLLVSRPHTPAEHLQFRDIATVLRRGDLLVVNASGTMKASIQARRTFGMRVELHVSTELPGGLWVVEVRQSDAAGSKPMRLGLAGEVLRLPGGARASILAPYPFAGDLFARARLWAAALELPRPLHAYLEQFGAPIRYDYVSREWPASYYQTIFATEPGSAEMPSAGRPFTAAVLDSLRGAGVAVAPIVLHTGVASLEDHEPPYEERFRVSRGTAAIVNRTRDAGGRVIAVGTTAVRALETATDESGVTHPGSGWTDLVIGPGRPIRAIDGLLTGFHDSKATHLAVVRAIASRVGHDGERLVDDAYDAALAAGYQLHEFGDVHLLLPS